MNATASCPLSDPFRLRMLAIAFVYFALIVAASPAEATTYTVGSTRTYHSLNAVAGLLNPGDLVLVDGDQTYPSALLTRSGTQSQPFTIRGVRVNGNRPILSGGINTIEVQSNWTVESFELTGGTSRCFYHHADHVALRDSLVRDCPAHGILGADTGSGSFTMEYNEVRHCGSGTNQHAIYMATNEDAYPGSVFRMQYNWVHDQNGGNAVKSRAERNEIYYNWIENTTYHLLELIGPDPSGGTDPNLKREDSDVVGNVLMRANDFFFVRIGGDGTGESAGRYRFLNNTFISNSTANGSAVFRCFDALESVEMHNNIFYSVPTSGGLNILRDVEANWVSGRQIAGQNNWVESGSVALPTTTEWTATITGADPKFMNLAAKDLRPAPGSPLVDAGTESGTPAPGFPFPNPLPLPLYVPPAATVQTGDPPTARPSDGKIDIGAYEAFSDVIFRDGFQSG